MRSFQTKTVRRVYVVSCDSDWQYTSKWKAIWVGWQWLLSFLLWIFTLPISLELSRVFLKYVHVLFDVWVVGCHVWLRGRSCGWRWYLNQCSGKKDSRPDRRMSFVRGAIIVCLEWGFPARLFEWKNVNISDCALFANVQRRRNTRIRIRCGSIDWV